MTGPLLREPYRLPLAFFASGMAALAFQVLWFRALGRVLGNTVWTGALVLTAFMLGMAIGGLLAARWARRIRDPARAFAIAEITVALTGSLLIWGLPPMEPVVGHWLGPLAGQPAATAAVRLALAFAAMLVPTIAMGVTLALGVRMRAHEETTRALGLLYAANTFGACLAPLLAEYHAIGALGLGGTALAAAGLNVVAAAVALGSRTGAAAPADPDPVTRAFPRRLLLAAAVAGGVALALEVIWFRLLILHAPGSDLSFAIMLSLVLLGIAIGGAAAPRLARLQCSWVAIGGSLAVVAGYALAGGGLGPEKSGLVAFAIPLMVPAAILSGALFTLLGAQLRADSGNPQPAIGILTTANTFGAALGAALAGLVLLPRLGMEWSLFILAAGYVLLAALVAKPSRLALPLAVGVAGLFLFPFGRMDAHLAAAARPYAQRDGSRVVHVAQGPTTTFQLLQREHFGAAFEWRLLTDSYSMTAIDRYAIRYMQLFAWLPAALHPDPRRALLISYGAGSTARALLDDPQTRELTVVDVSPEILGASPVMHGAADPLKDPRVKVVVEDGRQFLRTHRGSFDIITAEPPPPKIAGVVNLYTREYFMAVAARLAPGGLATYWLPVPQFEPAGAKAVTRAFCEAFPDCTLWAGGKYDWVLMGGRDFSQRPGAERFSRLWRDAAAAPRMAASGFESPLQVGATFLADAGQLRGWYGEVPALTDDRPKRIAPSEKFGWETPEYLSWLEPDGARRRFEASPWIAAHWPAGLVPASLPYFATQPILNGEIAPDPNANLAEVDAILRHTDLRTPVLWLLGSDAREQEIVDLRLAAGGHRPDYAYALGVRALAARDYPKAAERFAEAAALKRGNIGPLLAYSLCRAGRPQEAQAVDGAQALAPALRCWRL
jgi:spermidine synthase